MSSTAARSNADLVRQGFRLYEQGRFEEWIETFTDDVEIPALALVGSEQVYRGGEGLRRWLEELRASATTVHSYDDEYREADDGRVVVSGRLVVESGEGRGFGSVTGWVYTLRDGRVCRVDIYPHPNLALEAVGLGPAR